MIGQTFSKKFKIELFLEILYDIVCIGAA